ncbi:MAG: DUF4142 domain-containing protein [Polyangiaceae bacterium]|nr:DUF4142 domain-containing protein [Polyangiaceae bacterium]
MWRFDGAFRVAAASCLAAASLLGCDDDDAVATTGGAGPGEGGAGVGGGGAEPGVEEVGLTDSEIAHVLVTANEAEVAQATVVIERVRLPVVAAFAQEMIERHTAANEALERTIDDLGLDPKNNPVSFDLRTASEQTITLLGMTDDEILDDVYMESQVSTHEYLVSLIDFRLIVEAADPTLVQVLETTRAEAQAHLEEAQTIREQLSPTTGTTMPPVTDERR